MWPAGVHTLGTGYPEDPVHYPAGMSNGHIVQFFDNEESRARNVASFLAEGYAAHEPMFLVAQPANWSAIISHLERSGVSMQRAIGDGMFVVKDAQDTLNRVSPFGSPSSGAFQEVLGGTLQALARRGARVRIYGEMSDMLAQRGDFETLLKLEAIGNHLLATTPVHVLCGYTASNFMPVPAHRPMLDICSLHTSVRRHPDDHLAAWVLNAAHNHTGGSGNLQH